MSTGLDVLDKSVHKTHVWLNDLIEIMGWAPGERATDREREAIRGRAYSALRAVLHALRDRLTVNEAVQLGAQLPMVLRGMYYEGWHPSATPRKDRTKEEFLTHVAEPLIRVEEVDPEQATCGVFQLLARRVTDGEIMDVTQVLPRPIKELWPTPHLASEGPRTRRGERQGEGRRRKARARRMRKEIRQSIARARAQGLPSQDLPVLQTPRRLRRGAGARARRKPSGNDDIPG